DRAGGEQGYAAVARQLAGLARHLPIKECEFPLHCGDPVSGMAPPDALRPGIAHPEITDLALFDAPRHCADRILDRHCRIDPVLIIEIDDIDPKPLEARLAGLDNVGGTAVDAIGAARP